MTMYEMYENDEFERITELIDSVLSSSQVESKHGYKSYSIGYGGSIEVMTGSFLNEQYDNDTEFMNSHDIYSSVHICAYDLMINDEVVAISIMMNERLYYLCTNNTFNIDVLKVLFNL